MVAMNLGKQQQLNCRVIMAQLPRDLLLLGLCQGRRRAEAGLPVPAACAHIPAEVE